MSIIFKRLYDCDEHYYELDIDSYLKPCGEFIMYSDNNPEKGVLTGNMIKLNKIWKSESVRSDIGDVYVTPLYFASEFYPVSFGIEGRVEKFIKEATQARIDKQYEVPAENKILDVVSKELGDGEIHE